MDASSKITQKDHNPSESLNPIDQRSQKLGFGGYAILR